MDGAQKHAKLRDWAESWHPAVLELVAFPSYALCLGRSDGPVTKRDRSSL